MKKIFGKKAGSSPAPRLDGKVAVITGAASGIGAATARLFVSHGAKVILADIQTKAGKEISSELGSHAQFITCDVTKEADVAAAVDYALSSWGRLDIMFNNAGVPGPLTGLSDINIEEFDIAMAVHVKGGVLGVKHAARIMVPAGKGVILFSGSTASEMGGAGPPLHSAANAAVLSIVRSAAAELGRHGIRVNAVSPHYVATPMSIASFIASLNSKEDLTVEQFERVLAANSDLAGQVLTVEQVATSVLFLASEDAGYISGHNLVLDGGFTVTKPYDSSVFKSALQRPVESGPQAEARSKEKEDRDAKPVEKAAFITSPLKKEREKDEKARVKEEKAKEKEQKAAQKLAMDKEKQEKDLKEKSEKDKQRDEETARAKKEKLGKEAHSPTGGEIENKDSKSEKIPSKERPAEKSPELASGPTDNVTDLSASRVPKELEKEDKAREKEERAKEKEEKAAKKRAKEKERQKEKEEKAREKREKEKQREEEKARAKEAKREKKVQSLSDTMDQIETTGSHNGGIPAQEPIEKPPQPASTTLEN